MLFLKEGKFLTLAICHLKKMKYTKNLVQKIIYKESKMEDLKENNETIIIIEDIEVSAHTCCYM